jgi:hypothetical protein
MFMGQAEGLIANKLQGFAGEDLSELFEMVFILNKLSNTKSSRRILCLRQKTVRTQVKILS